MTEGRPELLEDGVTEEFEARCRDFLESHSWNTNPPNVPAAREFQMQLAAAGLAGLQYSTEYGGAGLTLEHERCWRRISEDYPTMTSEFQIGLGMCLPVINDFGSAEQKATYMPDLIAGRAVWCQMFSEPGAGSDLASLQTRAVRDGDEWVIAGQKVWTTHAHVSDYGILIARTDADVPKHAGISMFIVPLKGVSGIDIRPIKQMDGGCHFNEIFLADVRIPAKNLLGEYNRGWHQTTSMLMHERVTIGSRNSGSITQPTFDLLSQIADNVGRRSDAIIRDQLMVLYCMETTKALLAMRARAEMKMGLPPGPGGSLGKLAGSLIQRRVREIALGIVGAPGQAWDPSSPDQGSLQNVVVGSFKGGLGGGTDEIQRNIIGDRILGLPRDVSVDSGVPFRELRVGTIRS